MKESGGTLSITIVNSLATPAFNVPHIVLKISDTGSGIKTKDRHKIFDPFFTTKAVGEGSGLGLSVVHGIVESHNGSIEVKSNNMEGSTFIIRLPAIPEVGNLESPARPQRRYTDTIPINHGDQGHGARSSVHQLRPRGQGRFGSVPNDAGSSCKGGGDHSLG